MGASAARLRAVLRADAGPEVGYGHVVRTLALGEALATRMGADCVLVTRRPTGGFVLPLPDNRIELPEGLAVAHEAEEIARLAGPVDWVVADLYQATDASRRALRGPWGLVFVDDEGPTESCDLWVCPNLEAEERLSGFAGSHANVLWGAPHILLRAPFAHAPARAARDTIKRVLVCFGGSDTVALTARVVSWLVEDLPPSVEEVRVVTTDPRGLPRAAAAAKSVAFVAGLGASEMAEEMREADLAVTAAGTLLYEAAVLGLPSIWVSLNKEQGREADRFADLGAGLHLGNRDALRRETLADAIAQLAPATARQLAARRAQGAIDGLGCERVAARIGELHEQRLRDHRRPREAQ